MGRDKREKSSKEDKGGAGWGEARRSRGTQELMGEVKVQLLHPLRAVHPGRHGTGLHTVSFLVLRGRVWVRSPPRNWEDPVELDLSLDDTEKYLTPYVLLKETKGGSKDDVEKHFNP